VFKIPYLDFIGEMSLESYSIAKPLKLRINLNTTVFNVEEAYLTLSSEIYLKHSSEISGELILKGKITLHFGTLPTYFSKVYMKFDKNIA